MRTVRLQNGLSFSFESSISVERDEIPIIDVLGMYSDKLEDRRAVARQVREAAQGTGFFYVVNHVCIRISFPYSYVLFY